VIATVANNRYCIVLAAVLALGATGASAAPDASSLAQMGWIVGVWQGQNGADQVECVYLPQKLEEILGTFTAVANGRIKRYELRRFHADSGHLVMQELAYDAGMQPAAPVPTQAVLSTDATHIVLENATIERTGDNAMKVTVQLSQPARTVIMNFMRVAGFAPPTS